MRAILRTGFGGPEQLVIREIPKPEPKAGHAVIEVKAFGINHAEMHMRKGEWAEIADVSGIECVGVVKSCPGGEFAVGHQGGRLDGRPGPDDQRQLRRVHPRPRDERRGHRVGPPVGRPGRAPGVLRHGLDVPVPQPRDRPGPDAGHPGGDLLLRPGGPQPGRQRRGEGHRHHPQPRPVPDAGDARRRAGRRWRGRTFPSGSPRRSSSMPCSTWSATAPSSTRSRCSAAAAAPAWPAGSAACAGRRLQPAAADGQRRLPDLLRQLRVRHAGLPLSDVPLQAIADDVAAGR